MLQSSGIAIATVHSILVVINIVGNCLVCAIIKKHGDMRTPINYLLVNLAVADALYATLITPETFFKITPTHPEGLAGTVLCKIITGGGGNLAWIAGTSSVVTLAAIAAERYYAVIYPAGNAGKLTKSKLKGTYDPCPLSVLDGNNDGRQPDFSQEFLVIDALWPSDAQNRTETDVDEELHYEVQVLSAPPVFQRQPLKFLFASLFQVFIPGSWIFALIVHIPLFLALNVKDNACAWSHEWISKVYFSYWSAIVIAAMVLMAGLYSRIVCTLWFKHDPDNQLTFQQRGVLRVRKRVTLMGVTVTAIFGICWMPDVIVHNLGSNASLSISEDVYAVTHTVILFSSAVNPFVYALVNKNFREKLKGMICCSCTSSTGSTRTRGFPTKLTSTAGT
ncbi:neuropeptide Y receptor type 2-like [Orbicella faveolata]|uniref:neuropeptide Y receptor type 2-like n=1 Tax=Orbicella faveolata TaxID=48498 RepID=UPI0009E3336B|nr:neuropeptide Y receptor type 2-like [Orbicella faveolata]